MTIRRPRFSLRLMLIAVAVAAVPLWWAIRPYPVAMSAEASYYILWSDGSHSKVPYEGPLNLRRYGWFMAIDWSPRRTSYYLTPPTWWRRPSGLRGRS